MTQGMPLISMYVGVSAARGQALKKAGQPIPTPQNVQALIDTGASGTCIDPIVFEALQLQPTGITPMLTPSTGDIPVETETYDVSIVIPGTVTGGTPDPPFILSNVPVSASCLFAAQGFHALLGRDILQRCVLTYNGAIQLFTLAY